MDWIKSCCGLHILNDIEMGSSVSKSESGSTGSEWTGKLYFDPAADKSGPIYPIKNDELRTKLKELVDPKEKILRVEIYRHPLNSWQLSSKLWYHAFVLFETDGWW